MNNETTETVIFTYTGQNQDEIPNNITHLSVDASIDKIGIFFTDENPKGKENSISKRYQFIQEIQRRVLREIVVDLDLLVSRRDLHPFGCSFALNNGLIVVEFHDGLQGIGAVAFVLCIALKRISIPSTVLDIGLGAFLLCESLVQVDFREGLKVISSYAFRSCSSLSQISFPVTLEKIGDYAFALCSSLAEVNFQNSLKELGEGTFSYCTSLCQASLPSGLQVIARYTFFVCISLREVYLQEGLKTLGQSAFERCSSLTAISIPSTVTTIGDRAFYGCELLAEVDICTGLKALGSCAFFGCKSLSGFSIPSTVVSLGTSYGGSFSNCKSLLGIEMAVDASVYLPEMCLHSCDALVNMSLPSAMEYSEDAFESCSSLLLNALSSNDVADLLKDRFAELPIHECCYRSTTTTVSELFLQLQATNAEATNMTDVYQMTPFHVLVTTSKLRPDLLEILLNEYPLDILPWEDIHERTMVDYLLMNRAPSAIPMIELLLERAIVREMPRFGLSRWKSELSLVIESMDWSEDRRMGVDKVITRVAKYVGTEMSSLLELALWKKKIMQSSSGNKRRKLERESCLMTSGAEHVIPNVIGYFRKKGAPTGSMDASIVPSDISWLKQNLD